MVLAVLMHRLAPARVPAWVMRTAAIPAVRQCRVRGSAEEEVVQVQAREAVPGTGAEQGKEVGPVAAADQAQGAVPVLKAAHGREVGTQLAF